ncbi:LacI family DNA-binding transcriptional regulator [Schumannella soli]|uniref:LacI family transcriptional regulator n=1 Tax=Schumannella soli TaxID=2590779 RepID=A0A506XZK2_9MICO|nr:LacI family DNA-binding transcriptional regulator [Schumannella soli]TPW74148.1 LacI family transcriptional regulator [Schumannella soli]
MGIPASGATTLADVAARAGVSLKTASRAVNGEQHVREETRAKVLSAASDLGFQLNSSASLLARGIASSFVGVVTGDLANPFYAMLAQGAASELRAHQLSVTLGSSDESSAQEEVLVDELARRSVRAVIAASAMTSHAPYAALQRRGVPVVFVDRAPTDLDADSIVLDNAGGARAAAEHLLAGGHRRIAFLGDFERLPTYRERLDGFTAAMDAATGAVDAGWRELVREGAHDPEVAARVTGELLDAANPPTAIFASNNRATLGVLRELARRGDTTTALVGFDDFDLAEVLGVTVVAHDARAMGAQAARLVVERLADPRRDTELVRLPTRLVTRGSGERAPRA